MAYVRKKTDISQFQTFLSKELYSKNLNMSSFLYKCNCKNFKQVCLNYQSRKELISEAIEIPLDLLDGLYAKLVIEKEIIITSRKEEKFHSVCRQNVDQRKCMKCDQLFESTGVHNRLCSSCKIYAKGIYGE
jgi:hypothetical protein